MSAQLLQLPSVQYDVVALRGGLDQVTPTLSLKPGTVRDAVNWECSITGGYSRIAGYERFDGHPSPAAAGYIAMTVTVTGVIAVGATIVGASSAATGYVIYSVDGTVLITKVSGVFTEGETLNVSGTPQGVYVASGSPTLITPRLNATYLNLAASAYRPDISAVPGSGSILGLAYYGGTLYAWRNNVGGTAAAIYKSSVGGWTAVSLGVELRFTAGQAAGIVVGNTVTGASSGATGVVTRVVIESGTFAANSAAGRLIFATVTGTFTAAEALQVSASTRATGSGAQAAITLLPNGRVETRIANFGGTGSKRIYGADGVNRGFEFDGVTYVPIVTGMTVDKPLHLWVHKKHLFFSFGSSVQFSGIGAPYVWSPVLGAGEIVMPDDVTAFLGQPGDQTTAALAIYCGTATGILYGTSSADFDLKMYEDGQGGKAYSAQKMSASYVFDNSGVTNLTAAQTYGNFASASLTFNLRPFIQRQRNLLTASSVNREKSQYRVFFSNGVGLYMTIVNGKLMGSMPVAFQNPVTCACEGDTPDGLETAFFGSTDGMVYRLDAGTSFDGASIDSYMVLAWNSIKNPRIIKRFRKGSLEITGNSFAELLFGYALGYGALDAGDIAYGTNTTAVYWDQFIWDEFTWDGVTLSPTEVEVLGSAENIAVRLTCNSAEYETFTANSLIMHYSPRRGIR